MKTNFYKQAVSILCVGATFAFMLLSPPKKRPAHELYKYIYVAQDGWTAKSEKYILDIAKQAAAVFELDDAKAKRFSDCILDTCKKRFPSGIEGVPDNKLENEMKEMSKFCASQGNDFVWAWNPTTENLFRNYLMNMLESERMPLSEEQKGKWVSCVVEKLKLKYPEGVNLYEETVHQDMGKISEFCALKMLRSK